MKIALIGASGFVGSAVLQEALSRGHHVTALVRHPEKIDAQANLVALPLDAYDANAVAQAVENADAVVNAFNPGWGEADIKALHIKGCAAIVEGVKKAGVNRLLVVGGAGSLYVAPGLQLIDTPHFPEEYKEGAEGARQALNHIRQETSVEWTFVSPPAFLAPGERSGEYRLGGDDLLMDGDAPAGISVPDLAVAIIDELERPQHVRQRFTVARG